MPIPVPRRRAPRRGRGPRPRSVASQRERAEHTPSDVEEIERLAVAAIALDEQIGVTEEFITLADLLSFAQPQVVVPTPPIVTSPLGENPLTTPTPISPGAPGDYSYVAEAQRRRPQNLGRSDLGGLAVNTYQLQMAVAQAFGIRPGNIGGRQGRGWRSDHPTGHAIDIPGSGERGQQIADWCIARASTYLLKYVIFNHRIRYPGRGWKASHPAASLPRAGVDAYHLRHVHVSTY